MEEVGNGIINQCKQTGCGWKCCSFGRNGYIVTLPHEIEGQRIEHLEIFGDTGMGGKKVRCHAANTKTCDDGYKPIQCRIYPLWFADSVLRSAKCPLNNSCLKEHKEQALAILNRYSECFPDVDVRGFMSCVYVDRYIPFFDEIEFLVPSDLDQVIALEREYLNNPEECMKSGKDDIHKCLSSGCSVGIMEKGRLIAYSLSYLTEYGTGYVEKCFVVPNHRGQQIQQRLLSVNVALLKTQSVHSIYTMVSPQNMASITSFQKCGFVVVVNKKVDGHERLIMRRYEA